MTVVEVLKLLGWIVCGYITARVLYFTILRDDKTDGGDKLAAFLAFLVWPLALGAAIVIGGAYLLVRAITWERTPK